MSYNYHNELMGILENMNNFTTGLAIFVLILAVINYGLIMTVLQQAKRLEGLKRDIINFDDYLEFVRKINLKKKSDEKLILPSRKSNSVIPEHRNPPPALLPQKPRRIKQGVFTPRFPQDRKG